MKSRGHVRAQLATTVAPAGVPYGYTITLGGSLALSNGHLGSPNLGEALAFMVGGVAAFVSLQAAARVPTGTEERRAAPASVWSNAHLVSAGLAYCIVWGLIHLLGGAVAWLCVGFSATATYFLATALQRVLLAALHARRHRETSMEATATDYAMAREPR